MKRARFTEEQIIDMLRSAEASGSTHEICREQNITPQLFKRWQKAYGNHLSAEADGERPTRSQRTRDARAVNGLGLKLVDYSPADLDRLELPEGLREAIDVCQALKIRARSRQKRLVCQILRGEDHAAIRERVEALERARREERG